MFGCPVTLDSLIPHVIQVDMTGAKADNTILCAIGKLVNLQSLTWNEYTWPSSLSLASIAGLSKLQRLYITSTSLSHTSGSILEADQLSLLQGLTTLALPTAFGVPADCMPSIMMLHRLQHLHLAEQTITVGPALGGLRKLQTLYLKDVQMLGCLQSLSSLTLLTRVDLFCCKLGDKAAMSASITHAIPKLTRLQHLDLTCVKGLHFDMSACQGLSALRSLAMRAIQVRLVQPFERGLPNLTTLAFTYCGEASLAFSPETARKCCPWVRNIELPMFRGEDMKDDWCVNLPMLRYLTLIEPLRRSGGTAYRIKTQHHIQAARRHLARQLSGMYERFERGDIG